MTIRPHIKLQERIDGSINIHDYLDATINALKEYGVKQYITSNECCISSIKGNFFCIYFSEINEEVLAAYNALKEKYKDELDSGKFWLLKCPSMSWLITRKQEEEQQQPPLRINLNIDIDSFIAYMKERCIRRQTRSRTDERMPRANDRESRRSTFIAESVHIVNKSADVYVNGQLRNDFYCWIEEKSDAYIIHLSYNGANGYEEKTYIRKDAAISPVYEDSENTKSLLSVSGKNLAITFTGFDEWKSSRKHETALPTRKPTVIYTSHPEQRHEHAITKMSEVHDENGTIIVTIQDKSTDLTKNELKQSSIESRNLNMCSKTATHSMKTKERTTEIHKSKNIFLCAIILLILISAILTLIRAK